MEYQRRSDERPSVMDAPGVPGPARSPEPSRSGAVRGGGLRSGGARSGGLRSRGDGRAQPRPGTRAPRRLTAVGGGVVTLGATFAGGALDSWLFGGSGVLLGLAYVAVSFQVAVRVRPADLAAAPICGPISFAITLGCFGSSPSPGLAGDAIGLASSLATRAGWLFTGTAVSVVIALARHFALSRARRRAA
ncbi:DUF6542 domain-containing protein [Streptacidiphilus sp. P02-A3a]|uniref:DUF6542 domain-containing protein n=1 Tax=Streptacidiphilus sp. P02-A3a TaxID=2704468 RepID=UPI0015F88C54|nr:DUF6542 domain-containing protein [Streptacidiphilus sp. P02-A3a]QMU67688.1 hypothetical protein GXP74_05055 [Streptacidiphilus sp. P02-A3a]